MGGRGGGARGATSNSASAYVAGRTADEQAVINAYARKLGETNDWVRLSQLRPELDRLGWDRERQDRALTRMFTRPDTNIITIANLKSLTPADNAAGLQVGGQQATAISIRSKATTRRFAAQARAARERANSPASQARAQAQREMVAREVAEAAQRAR